MNSLHKIFWTAVLGVLVGSIGGSFVPHFSPTFGLLLLGALGIVSATIAGRRSEDNNVVSFITTVAVSGLLYALATNAVHVSLVYAALAGGLGGLAVHELLSGKIPGCALGILGGTLGGLGAGFVLQHCLPGSGLCAFVAGSLTGTVTISVVLRYRSFATR